MWSLSMVMRLHFVSALARRFRGAHKVMTAGVQQALQTLEITGASASALPDGAGAGEEFRQAFTAKVGSSLSEDGGNQASAASTAVAQSQAAVAQSGSSRSWSFLQAQTRSPVGAKPIKALALASEAAARTKSNLPASLATKPTSAANIASVEELTAATSQEKTNVTPDAAPVPDLVNAEGIQKTVAVEDASALLSGTSNLVELAPTLTTRSLPITIATKADGSGPEIADAGAWGRKHEVVSSTHGHVALAASEPGPLASSTAVTPSTGFLGALRSTETSVSLSASVPAPSASAENLAAVRAENTGHNGGNSGDAAWRANAAPESLAGSTRYEKALDHATGESATNSSVLGLNSASIGRENLDRFGDQPGVNRRTSESVSERVGVSPVAPGIGLSSRLATGVRQTGALESALSSTLSSTPPTKSVSSASISGTGASLPDSASRVSTGRAYQVSIRGAAKVSSPFAGVSLGSGVSGQWTVEVAGEGVSSVHAANESTNDSSPGRSQAVALPVSELRLPAEVPGPAIAASRTAIASGRDRTIRGPANREPADDNDAAIDAAQTAPDKASSSALLSAAVAPSKDVAVSAVPPAGIAISPISAHPASVPLSASAVLVHAAGSLGAAQRDRSDGKLDIAGTTPAAATSQGGDSHRTLLATPTTLEVGLQSGTEGWLKIRAVAGEGDVKASLDAVSASGRELLHSQLPALNAFLHNEQVPVTASVAERSTAPGASAAGTSMGSSGFSGASHGALSQQGGDQQASERQVNISSSETAPRGSNELVKSYDAGGSVGDSIDALSARQAGAPGENGRWLNVRV